MARLVMKFGGTSVADIDRIRNVARHVKREVDAGFEVAVVVSAMSGKTNELVAWCKEAAPLYDQAEYDTVVASGEQVTSGLMAIVLREMGIPARSWQGWQIPIYGSDAHGSARIVDVDGAGIIAGFENSWAPWMELGTDQPGVADLDVVQRFVRETVPFADLKPADDVVRGSFERGTRPLALADAARSVIVVYFPAGGSAEIAAHGTETMAWFDPRTGATTPIDGPAGGTISAPAGTDEDGHPLDAVLVLRA